MRMSPAKTVNDSSFEKQMAFMFASRIPATTLYFIPRLGGKSSHIL